MSSSDKLPDKIGKYDIVDVLGKGSMGLVYKGHDPYVDRAVAIKVATNTDAEDDGESMAKRMFVNEARSAGRLDHSNILKVYEAGEEQEPERRVLAHACSSKDARHESDSDTVAEFDVLEPQRRHFLQHRITILVPMRTPAGG